VHLSKPIDFVNSEFPCKSIQQSIIT